MVRTVDAGVAAFVARWEPSGGAERANAQPFITELTHLIGVGQPDAVRPDDHANDYIFERRVDHRHRDGTSTPRFIDCYKRDHFILEAKQGAEKPRRKAAEAQAELAFGVRGGRLGGTAQRGTAAWDAAMRGAYNQACGYVADLPPDHRAPPFILLVDVGYVIEVYADFSGQGRNYTQFPDRRSYRIAIGELADPDVRERLTAIWTEPQSLDPTRKAAEVTRDIADRLAKVAKSLERKGFDPKAVADFLMRCLFTMFAEDVGLLPEHAYRDLLRRKVDEPQTFAPAMEALWRDMDNGGYSATLGAIIKRFNGGLFSAPKALPLAAEDIHELAVAAGRDWSDVEPAIFGTLLERALDARERSALGAHYTPRAYVERLVVPTIIEPLRDDWVGVQGEVEALIRVGRETEARETVRTFHHALCTTRVLDPA